MLCPCKIWHLQPPIIRSSLFVVKTIINNPLNHSGFTMVPIKIWVVYGGLWHRFTNIISICRWYSHHFVPQKSHDFPMVFWFSYGFPMVFLWFSHGFPMDSPVQPTQIGDPLDSQLEPREEIESELGPDTDEVVGILRGVGSLWSGEITGPKEDR